MSHCSPEAVMLTLGEFMLTITWINPIITMSILGVAYCLVIDLPLPLTLDSIFW